MLKAGLTPNVVTYTSLMVVLRKGGQQEKCIDLLRLMQEKVVGCSRGSRRQTHFSRVLGIVPILSITACFFDNHIPSEFVAVRILPQCRPRELLPTWTRFVCVL